MARRASTGSDGTPSGADAGAGSLARDTPGAAPSATTIAAFVDHLRHERQLAKHTLDAYGRDLDRFADWLADTEADRALEDARTHHVRGFIASEHRRGLQGRSIRRALSSVRALFEWLAREGRVDANPAAGIRPPKSTRRLPRTLDADQMQHLLADTDETAGDWLEIRDQAAFELLYSSGLRLSELVGLDVRDIDLAEGGVRVTGKGSKTRSVPVGRIAREAIERWLRVRTTLLPGDADPFAGAVFLGARGKRLGQRALQLRLAQRGLTRGIDGRVHPHALRHSFASHVLESSGDLRAVQEMLGHADIGTTQIYTHLDFQHLASVYDDAHPRSRRRTGRSTEGADAGNSEEGESDR